MVPIDTVRKLALSLPDTQEAPHFEKTSFRAKKKIFVTLDEKSGVATFKFSEIDQSVFCTVDKSAIYPVPNKWGKSGWTHMVLSKVTKSLVKDALQKAYEEVVRSKRKS